MNKSLEKQLINTAKKMKYYTGIGSRKTPKHILKIMTCLAVILEKEGWILRSGGAIGSDKAFEAGVSAQSMKQIFQPEEATVKAIQIAAKLHPAWNSINSDYVKKLHGRNSFQVLGKDLSTPSKFIICWTPDGCKSHDKRSIKTGGTGTAISIASKYKIPVFNLANKEDYERIITKTNARDHHEN